jgi:WD40 repeat protein
MAMNLSARIKKSRYSYWAFVSYSHRDEKMGAWLHRSLEKFRVPKPLVGRKHSDTVIPRRFFPIFRDRDELPTAASLGKQINQALRESRFLIVVCSPNAAKSQWVNEEIKYFKSLGREDRVMCFIVDGEPNAPTGQGQQDKECFPPAIRFQVDKNGKLLKTAANPIAADARRGRDGRRNAFLKLIAGIIGVGFNKLKRRESERRFRAMTVASALMFIMVLSFAILTWQAVSAKNQAVGVQSDLLLSRAHLLIDSGETQEALANLARAIELNPANRVAAARTIALITQRNYPYRLTKFEGHKDQARSCRFSSDGRYLVSAGHDRTAKIWDTRTGLLHGKPMVQRGKINSAVFSPDNRFVLTASTDGMASLWDALTTRRIVSFQHDEEVLSAQFSQDGQHIITASSDSSVVVWDLDRARLAVADIPDIESVRPGTPWAQLYELTPFEIKSIGSGSPAVERYRIVPFEIKFAPESAAHIAAFSPNGTIILTASVDKTVRLWDITQGLPAADPLRHENPVRKAVFSPDGRMLATATIEGVVRIWNTATGQQMLPSIHYNGSINSIVFSQDSRRLVIASNDETAGIWDTQSGMRVGAPLQHGGIVSSAMFNPPGNRLVTASWDGTARIWNAENGTPVSEPLWHQSPVLSAEFSPTESTISTSSVNGDVLLWNYGDGRKTQRSLSHPDAVRLARFSHDGANILTVCDDGMLRVWAADTGALVCGIAPESAVVNSAEFSPKDQWLVAALSDGTARIWEVSTGTAIGPTFHHQEAVLTAGFDQKLSAVLTSSHDGTARIWDLVSGKPVSQIMRHNRPVLISSFSPKSRFVATVSSDNRIRIWHANSGFQIVTLPKFRSRINDLNFRADGNRLLVAAGNTAQIWDTANGTPISKPLDHPGVVWDANFSPNGQWIVTACFDGAARIWDADAMNPAGVELKHHNIVMSATFSSDSRWVLTASRDGTARIWDPQTGRPVADSLAHNSALAGAMFSPDGNSVLTYSENGEVIIWHTGLGLGEPYPKWLPGFAAAVGGAVLNVDGGVKLLGAPRQNMTSPIDLMPESEQDAAWRTWVRTVTRSNRTQMLDRGGQSL